MSIFGAMFSGVTGLNAQSQALGMIADNISNMNTVGYKGTTARFFTLVTQAASRTTFTPGGVASSPAQGIDRQGLLQSSISKTDIAIAGRGFFVVNQSATPTIGNEFLFTRAGSFDPDENGNLVNTAGYYLQGWPLTNGTTLPTNTSTLSSVQTVNVGNLAGTATPTSNVNLALNLPSTAPAAAGGGQINAAIATSLNGITDIDFKTFGTLNDVAKITYVQATKTMTMTIGGQTGTFDLSNAAAGIYTSTGTLAGMEMTLNTSFDFNTDVTAAANTQTVTGGGTLALAGALPTVSGLDAGDLAALSTTAFKFDVTAAGVVTVNTGPTGFTVDAAQTETLDTLGNRNIVVTDGTNSFTITLDVTGVASAVGTIDIDLQEHLNSFGLGTAPGGGRFAATVQIFDSLGNAHDLVIEFDKVATNQWEILVNDPVLASTGVKSGTAAAASRNITFNGDGTPSSITFPAVAISGWTTGANDSSVTVNLGTSGQADGVSQFAGEFALSSIDQNGVTFGGFVGVNIDKTGTVTAVFDNGEQLAIYKLPVTLFANPNGLETVTGNAFRQTDTSGDMLLQQANTGGTGAIASSALESSTVDLAEEFTKMITTQRAYSASAKIITTADEMLEELIRIRR
jgi:flagellar hook protein FlgE